MKCCIVIPTYNERENIGELLRALLGLFKDIKSFKMMILVVDDNSPDGTQDVVKKFVDNKTVFMTTGKKEGLGSAYIKGFSYAIDKLDSDILFEMDSDFSHDPNDIPRFLVEIKKGYDLIIGSRYINGGSTPDWDIKRKIVSRGGNFFARIVAGLSEVHDCTSGFRAIRSSVIKKINIHELNAQGYAFQMNLLWDIVKKGARIKEIPIVFRDRDVGRSKMGWSDIYEFFVNSFKLRFGK